MATPADVEVFFRENLEAPAKARMDADIARVAVGLARLFPSPPPVSADGGSNGGGWITSAAAALTAPPAGVAFITSGGTTVPLERRPVRYLTNFSSGGRGSFLTESLAERGWTCVLLRHQQAVRPFRRSIDALSTEALFAMIEGGSSRSSGEGSAEEAEVRRMAAIYRERSHALLEVSFDTVVEYLYLLRGLSRVLCGSGGRDGSGSSATPTPVTPPLLLTRPLLFFAAAAVSDYYVPLAAMAADKISGGDGLTLRLENVPKTLGLLQDDWLRRSGSTDKAPLLVSFKLETCEAAMRTKAVKNLHQYGSDAVVANMLQTYKERVWVYVQGADDGLPTEVERTKDRTIEAALCDYFIHLAVTK